MENGHAGASPPGGGLAQGHSGGPGGDTAGCRARRTRSAASARNIARFSHATAQSQSCRRPNRIERFKLRLPRMDRQQQLIRSSPPFVPGRATPPPRSFARFCRAGSRHQQLPAPGRGARPARPIPRHRRLFAHRSARRRADRFGPPWRRGDGSRCRSPEDLRRQIARPQRRSARASSPPRPAARPPMERSSWRASSARRG